VAADVVALGNALFLRTTMPSSTTGYERIPSEPERSPSPRKAHGVDEESEVVDRASAEKRALAAAQLREQERALAADPRFNPEAPSVWKRVALILFLIFMFWLAVRMRLAQVPSQANVVYADRCDALGSDACARSAESLQVLGGAQIPPRCEPHHHGGTQGRQDAHPRGGANGRGLRPYACSCVGVRRRIPCLSDLTCASLLSTLTICSVECRPAITLRSYLSSISRCRPSICAVTLFPYLRICIQESISTCSPGSRRMSLHC
jgi:hypothetical protein